MTSGRPTSWMMNLPGSDGERLNHPGDLRLRGGVAPHSVHRHADHPQASSTSTCFLPR